MKQYHRPRPGWKGRAPHAEAGIESIALRVPCYKPRPDWQQRAACRGMDVDAWFAMQQQAALAVCQRCPVRVDCATSAVRAEMASADTNNIVGLHGIPASARRSVVRQLIAEQEQAA